MSTILPSQLPAAPNVTNTAALIVDSGSIVEKATPAQIVNAAAPVASEAEALAGVENTKRMTALRVRQSLGELLSPISADIASLLSAVNFVTPEQFGAVGLAANYYLGTAADDTSAVQAAIDTGRPVFLSGVYMVSGLTMATAGQQIFGPGKLVKKRNVTDQVIRVNAAKCRLDNVNIDGFNASFVGSISGNTLTIISGLVGTITIDTVNNRGPILDADGIIPGTRIISGSGSTYTLSNPLGKSQTLTSRTFRFTDAPAFFQDNDLIYTEYDDLTVTNVFLDGSAGGGISSVGGARLRVNGFTIRNVHDNGIFVACVDDGRTGADDAAIANGTVIGTGIQNGIFFTASAGSTATTVYLYRPVVANVVCLYAGDTPFEFGIHVDGGLLTNAVLGLSKSPPLLVRDAKNCNHNNVVIVAPDNADQSADWAAISVVKQTESASWNCNTVFDNIKLVGRAKRGFAFINQSNVTVQNCRGVDGGATEAAGSDLQGGFVVLGDAVNNITVRDNSASNWLLGVLTNLAGTAIAQDRIVVEDNEFTNMGTVFAGNNVTFTRSRCVRNTIRGALTGVYNLSSAVFTPTLGGENGELGGEPGLVCDDDIARAGFEDATPYIFNPANVTANGVATRSNAAAYTLQGETDGDLIFGNLPQFGECTVSIVIPGANEAASFAVSAAASTVTKISGTANLLPEADIGGSTGWVLVANDGLLFVRRRGANVADVIALVSFR